MTREQIDKVLKEIQESVPKLLLEKLHREELVAPQVAFVVEKALEDPDFPEEKKKALRDLKDQGHFDKTHVIEDPKIAKQIDNYVAREIKKAVKEGRLPTKKQLKELGLDKLHD